MQCPSCQFENMPGVDHCGRCGAQLGLARSQIDVHPPRASQLEKRLRAWFPWYGLRFRLRESLRAALRPAAPVVQPIGIAYRQFFRMLVPGWPQLHAGRIQRGRWMLGGYAALIALGLLSLGTQIGAVMLGAAVAIHVASVIDIVWEVCDHRQARLILTGLIILVLGGAIYAPVAWSATRWFSVRRLGESGGPFRAGDAIVYRPLAYRHRPPSPGDLVFFAPDSGGFRGSGDVYYRFGGGDNLDRILAGPGQSVHWDHSQLWVDGTASSLHPLDPTTVPVDLQLTVPEGYYFILPSVRPSRVFDDSADFLRAPDALWQQISLVPRERIRGRVFLRHRPMWRWRRVR